MKQIYRYRAVIVIALTLLCFGHTQARQQLTPDSEVNESFYQSMNHVFAPLEKNRVPHRLLRDFALELINLEDYNGASLTQDNYTDFSTFMNIYQTLLSARVSIAAGLGKSAFAVESDWNQQRTQGRIVLAALCYRYASFRPDAVSNNLVTVSNGQIYDRYVNGVWQDPYQTDIAVALTPPISEYKGRRFEVVLPSSTWLSNQNVSSVQFDPSDGFGYRSLSINQPITVQYADTGLVEWKYRVVLSSGQQLYSHSLIHIGYAINPADDQPPTFSTFHHGPFVEQVFPGTAAHSGGIITVRYAADNVNQEIRRPLIIAEGYDTGHILSPEKRHGDNTLVEFLEKVERTAPSTLNDILIDNQEYDIIYVDWRNGTDNLFRNAELLKEVIRFVNGHKVADNGVWHQNVIIGQSMGGVITRIALRQMENDNENHDTRLYISHDAPHQGANTPLAFQHFGRHMHNLYIKTGTPVLAELIQFIRGRVSPWQASQLADQVGSRQLLINYVANNGQIDNTVHDAFQQQLTALGCPAQTRNVAISNGSECAQLYPFGPGGSLLYYRGRSNTRYLGDLAFARASFLITPVYPISQIFFLGKLPGRNDFDVDLQLNAVANNGGNRVYYANINYKKSVLWLIPVNVVFTYRENYAPTGILPLDGYPGGWFPTGLDLQRSNVKNWLVKNNIYASNQPEFNFIPIPSALDIGGGSNQLLAADYTRIYQAGNPPVWPRQTPFANFVLANDVGINSVNERHISFSPRIAEWTGLEMQNPNQPSIFDCNTICEREIAGPSVLCTTGTYQIVDFPAVATATWQVSPSHFFTTASGTGSVANLQYSNYGQGGQAVITFSITGNCGTVNVSRTFTAGTPSAYEGGTYNDGVFIEPLGNTANFVYNQDIYFILTKQLYLDRRG